MRFVRRLGLQGMVREAVSCPSGATEELQDVAMEHGFLVQSGMDGRTAVERRSGCCDARMQRD